MSLKKDVQGSGATRPDLAEVLAAKANTLDENRPKAIANVQKLATKQFDRTLND